METVHDINQLLVIGYLREILPESIKESIASPSFKGLDPSDDVLDKMPSLETMNTNEFEQKMMDYHGHLDVPALGINPTSTSEELSLASHLSDGFPKSLSLQSSLSQMSFSIPAIVIENIYFYYHRHQSYLLLLGGSEECKDNSLNQVQILNVQNSSDIAQKIEYPMLNHSLKLHVWRENVVMVRQSLVAHHLFLNHDSGKEHVCPSPSTLLRLQQSHSHDSFTGDPEEPNPTDKGIPIIEPQSPSNNSSSSPFAEVDGDAVSGSTLGTASLSPKALSTTSKRVNTKKRKKNSVKKRESNSKRKSRTLSTTDRRSSMKKAKTKEMPRASKSKKARKSSVKKKAKSKRHKTMMVPTKSKGKSKNKNPITGDWHFDRYDFGQCLMALPPHSRRWPWFKGKYEQETHDLGDVLEFNKYKMMVRCGGIYSKDDEYSNENDLILFNATNLNEGASTGSVVDAFHLKLPAFKERLRSPAVCYNGMDHMLSFGGYSYSSGKAIKHIYALDLNAKRGKMKWKKYGCSLLKPRLEAAATHFRGIDHVHRVLIIGGKGSNEKPLDSVEVFDSCKTTKSSKCVQLKEMNFKRSRPGSCLLDGPNGRRFAVSGGIMYGKGTHTVELYDLEKDHWTVHPTVLQYEHMHPTMWTLDVINPNILYVAGNSVRFGAKKGSVGFVEFTDLRMKAKQFELLYNDPLDDFYSIEATRGNLWEPRSLMHFTL